MKRLLHKCNLVLRKLYLKVQMRSNLIVRVSDKYRRIGKTTELINFAIKDYCNIIKTNPIDHKWTTIPKPVIVAFDDSYKRYLIDKFREMGLNKVFSIYSYDQFLIEVFRNHTTNEIYYFDEGTPIVLLLVKHRNLYKSKIIRKIVEVV